MYNQGANIKNEKDKAEALNDLELFKKQKKFALDNNKVEKYILTEKERLETLELLKNTSTRICKILGFPEE
ncbi:MAG: hypothetical protein JST81_13030 [Bacteroidetes bacterium]|jgi:hypothetical protein|nr:hypothetical protein [Bacteroidota bacterium]